MFYALVFKITKVVVFLWQLWYKQA